MNKLDWYERQSNLLLHIKNNIKDHSDKSEDNKTDGKMDTDENEDNSCGVFLVQCLLNSPETTAVKHFLPPAKLDNNIEGEITSVQFW